MSAHQEIIASGALVAFGVVCALLGGIMILASISADTPLPPSPTSILPDRKDLGL